MDSSFATFAMSTPTIVLSYAAAFFCVIVGIAAAYTLFKAGGTLGRVDTVLDDVDKQAVPLMQKAGTTLDGVNANLGNVDQITKDVADITDKIDAMANAVEGAVSTPARKAASFSAGVQGAVCRLHAPRQAGAGCERRPAQAPGIPRRRARGRLHLLPRQTPRPPLPRPPPKRTPPEVAADAAEAAPVPETDAKV